MASQLYWFNTVSQKSNDHLTILWGWFSCWVVIFLAKALYCNCNYIYLLRSLKNSYQDQKYGYIPSLISKKANLKTGVLRKQSTPNFPKNEHFLTPNKHDEWKIFLKTLVTGILATLLVVAFFRNLFFNPFKTEAVII